MVTSENILKVQISKVLKGHIMQNKAEYPKSPRKFVVIKG